MLKGLNPIRTLAWAIVKRLIRQTFPTVQSISTGELASWLASDRPPPLLIDARQAEEYAVSHLPGAHHWPTLAAVQRAAVKPETAIVVYCSVGYRSARLAQQLQDAGYTHVMNLAGSIFEWHNRGQSLVVDDEPTRSVHPYNRTWGLLLEPRE